MKEKKHIPVHVFDPEEHGLKRRISSHPFSSSSSTLISSKQNKKEKTFSSSSSSFLFPSKKSSSLLSKDQEEDMDKALFEKYEDMADMEIDSMWSILEKLKESSLTGRERRRYFVKKAALLSNTAATPEITRAPFKVQMKRITREKERNRAMKEMERQSNEGYILKKKKNGKIKNKSNK